MSLRTRLVVFFATVPVIAFTLIGGYLGNVSAGEDTYRHLRVFEDVVSLISNNYVERVDLDDVMHGALRGLAEGLDTDSAYLSREEADRIERGEPLPDGRVGIELTRRYYTQVIAARDASPAAEAGILPGDYVRAIDGEPTRLLSAVEGQRQLRGEPGSTVTLSLIRGSTQEPYDVTLTRERLTPPGVSGRLLAGASGIGYVRIPFFAAGVAARIAETVDTLAGDGASHVIIDVRNTAEGTYDAAIEAARLFVADGTLVIRAEAGGERDPIAAAPGAEAISVPATILINFGSSGPAELFAAALVDRERATAVGQRTAGRVGLQRLIRLPDGTGLWLSWARYLTAGGEPIHPYGIEPEVPVDMTLPELGEPLPEEDPILDRAIESIASEAA